MHVSSAYFTARQDEVDEHVKSLVKRENKMGDRTHPCGAPVFRILSFETDSPKRTYIIIAMGEKGFSIEVGSLSDCH